MNRMNFYMLNKVFPTRSCLTSERREWIIYLSKSIILCHKKVNLKRNCHTILPKHILFCFIVGLFAWSRKESFLLEEVAPGLELHFEMLILRRNLSNWDKDQRSFKVWKFCHSCMLEFSTLFTYQHCTAKGQSW